MILTINNPEIKIELCYQRLCSELSKDIYKLIQRADRCCHRLIRNVYCKAIDGTSTFVLNSLNINFSLEYKTLNNFNIYNKNNNNDSFDFIGVNWAALY